jgi:hypothetical protein
VVFKPNVLSTFSTLVSPSRASQHQILLFIHPINPCRFSWSYSIKKRHYKPSFPVVYGAFILIKITSL